MFIKNTSTSSKSFFHRGAYHQLLEGEQKTFPDTDFLKLKEIVESTTGLAIQLEDADIVQGMAGEGSQSPKAHVVSTDITNAELQELINNSPAGTNLVLQARATTYGNLTLKSRVSLHGLQSDKGTSVIVGKVTFAPETGVAGNNEVVLSNILFANGNQTVVEILGSAPVRVKFNGCHIISPNGEDITIKINNDLNGSSVQFNNCSISSNNNTTYVIETNAWWTNLKNTDITGSNIANVTGGLYHVEGSQHDGNGDNVITLRNGSRAAIHSSEIKNVKTNGNGFFVENGAILSIDMGTRLDIKSGTGFVIDGDAGGSVALGQFTNAHIDVMNVRNNNISALLNVAYYPTTLAVL